MNNISNLTMSAIAGLIMMVNDQTANAAHYHFSQGGFTGGGKISGYFEGKDTYVSDGNLGYPGKDGNIIQDTAGGHDPDLGKREMTAFAIHFSGNALFNGLNQYNLQKYGIPVIYYSIATNGLNLSLYSNELPFFVYDSQTSINKIGGNLYFENGSNYFNVSTPEAIVVTQTPLPGALGLFAAAIACLNAIGRKKKLA